MNVRNITGYLEDEMHIFVCPNEPLKGAYLRVINSRAYRQFHSADALSHMFLTQRGPEFWSRSVKFAMGSH
jgi:hypothetical protein